MRVLIKTLLLWTFAVYGAIMLLTQFAVAVLKVAILLEQKQDSRCYRPGDSVEWKQYCRTGDWKNIP